MEGKRPRRRSSARLGRSRRSESGKFRRPARRRATPRIESDELRTWLEPLTSRPEWGVVAFGTDWFCPYCGKVGCRLDAEDPDPLAGVLRHLRACARFGGAGSTPIFRARELETRAHVHHVKAHLAAEPAWYVRDRLDRWVCPYCAESTSVTIPGGAVDRTILESIAEHVRACSAFDPADPDRFRSADDVRRSVASRAAADDLAIQVEGLLETQGAWIVRDDRGAWLCPYCRRPAEGVPRDPGRIEEVARRIAQHLVDECSPYRDRVEPARSAAALRAEASGGSSPGADPAPSRGSDLQPISQILDACQARFEEQADQMRRELDQARQRQRRMLPPPPAVEGFEFEVVDEPCTHLGGDFYDFIDLGPGRLGIVIGDVSGHGADAALVMGVCKKVMSLAARGVESPRRAVAAANEEIARDLDGKTFVTLLYGVLDTATGEFRFVRAGHEPILVCREGEINQVEAFLPAGMAVGLAKGPRFVETLEERRIQLHPGDVCLLYTDGVVESTYDDEPLGRDRLEDLFLELAGQELVDVVSLLHMEVYGDPPGRHLEDDMTILAFRRRG